ncbi:hypothetical protein Cgig2_021633 [Carnegiea gigantea]|uniref:Mitotic checkpoint protein BUB3.3 n=1 Tax=Carnegiea gigantea TaxID=171969 RepID=A0A9Q1GJI7_9CARY|nr:hypothetical protein Cgig2_021633 [Carnegiea gigantea]
MSGTRLNFDEPIGDGITRLRFSPESNNLLISSWDSKFRLFDVDSNRLRLEAQTEAAHLDCCFESGFIAYSAGSDGSVCRYDLHSGAYGAIGRHDDVATCIEYSDATGQVITTGWDGKILSWDSRIEAASQEHLIGLTSHAESMSVWGFELLVATGSLVHKHDLRKLDGAVHKQDLSMGVPIRCMRSVCPNLCWEGFAVGSVDGRVTLQSNSEEMEYLSAIHYWNIANNDDDLFTFRCHPKSKNGKYHLVAVNDITFNPSVRGAIVTGDDEGYVIAWDARRRRRLLELPRCPNSVAALSYNHTGEFLAIASSYTCQEANEIEDHPQIFIQEMGESHFRSASAKSSS